MSSVRLADKFVTPAAHEYLGLAPVEDHRVESDVATGRAVGLKAEPQVQLVRRGHATGNRAHPVNANESGWLLKRGAEELESDEGERCRA